MNNHKSLFLLVSISLLFILTSCIFESDDDSPSNSVSLSIKPLAVGNTWTYLDSSFTSNDTMTVKYSITEKQNYQGEDLYMEKGTSNYITILSYWSTKNGSLYYRGVKTGADSLLVNNLYLKYPAEILSTWQTQIVNYSFFGEFIMGTYNIQCVSTSSTFTTPAGIFSDCYQYKSVTADTESENVIDMFYKPGVGCVGSISTENNQITHSSRLTSYHLN